MRNILIINPYVFLKNNPIGLDNLFYYEEGIIRKFGDNDLVICNDIYDEFDNQVTINEIKRHIDSWIPIWVRWIGRVDDFELLKSECIIFVYKMIQQLRINEIRYSIFFTNSSHHLENSLIEISLSILKIPQIFLYATVFGENGRLLPLMQNTSFEERKKLDFRISNHEISEDISSFIDGLIINLPPKLNEKFSKLDTMYFFGILILLTQSLKLWIYNLLINNQENKYLNY